MHPLVTKIRFWIWLASVIAISCLWPAYGMFALGTGFGWWKGCGCCSSGDGDCNECTSGTCHNNQQVVVTGIVEGTCGSCASLNQTITISTTRCSTGGSCVWSQAFASSCSISTVTVTLVEAGSTTKLNFIYVGSITYSANYQSSDLSGGTGNDIDCGYSGVSCPFASTSGLPSCDFSASTASVTAI